MIRLAMLDTCAAIAASAAEPVVRRARQAQANGGITGWPARAMILGTAAHAQDFDDYEALSFSHPSAVLVPVLLALAEHRALTLARATQAYAAGYETILALGQALGHAHYLRGWHATATLGMIGAARAAAQALGLSLVATTHALGIAMSRAAGLKVQFGSDVKPLHAGLAASGGVQAALLAQAGVQASDEVFEGQAGFFALYSGPDSPGPGQGPLPRMADHPIYFKPWPSCAYTHRATEAALELAGGPVDHAKLEMAAPYAEVCGLRAPRTPAQARFSATWCVAAALTDGVLGPQSFAPAQVSRADIAALEARIELSPYPLPEGAGDMSPMAPDTLSITRADGSEDTRTVRNPPGGPAKPVGRAAVVGKFVDCGGAENAADGFLDAPGSVRMRAPLPLVSDQSVSP